MKSTYTPTDVAPISDVPSSVNIRSRVFSFSPSNDVYFTTKSWGARRAFFFLGGGVLIIRIKFFINCFFASEC